MYTETVGVEGKSGSGKLVSVNSVSGVMWICSVHKSILRYVDVDLFMVHGVYLVYCLSRHSYEER